MIKSHVARRAKLGSSAPLNNQRENDFVILFTRLRAVLWLSIKVHEIGQFSIVCWLPLLVLVYDASVVGRTLKKAKTYTAVQVLP